MAAQTQSRNWCISASGSCLKLFPPASTNWQQDHGKTGREENPQLAYPRCLALWSQQQGCPDFLLCLNLSNSSRSFLSSKGSKVQADSLDFKSVHHGHTKFIMKWPLFIRGRHIIFFLKNVTSQASLYPQSAPR